MSNEIQFSTDWEELLSLFLKHEVKFVIVGGHAVAAYGAPRYTEDLDIFIERSELNATKIISSLRDFFSSDVGLTSEQFTLPNKVTMLGNKPFRVDILTSIDGVEFLNVFTEAESYRMGGNLVNVISKKHLILNKKKSGREKDLLDISVLKKLP